MTASTTLGNPHLQATPRENARIWLLQYGPCWCHSVPTDSASFDYFHLRRTVTELGTLQHNLLIMSARVIDGTNGVFRQVYDEVPDPKLVISADACPAARRFWDDLPNGWTALETTIPVDIHVHECISGKPELLMGAVLSHLFMSETSREVEKRTAILGG